MKPAINPRSIQAKTDIGVSWLISLYENYSDLRKLWLSVRPDGCIHVGMGMRNHSPAKHYELNVLKATSADLEGTVLDFLDVNTPK